MKSDYLTRMGVPVPNTWVQLVRNSDSAAFVSSAATSLTGYFEHSAPADIYTIYTGPSNVGPWTVTENVHYIVAYTAGDDAALRSVSAEAGGPYVPGVSAGQGGAQSVMPRIVADGATDNHDAILAWIAAMLPTGGKTAPLPPGNVATSPLDLPAAVILTGSGGLNRDVVGTVGTRLIPAGPGQAYVLNLANRASGIEDLNVDGLTLLQANVATSALKVDAAVCVGRKFGVYGGSASSLVGTVNSTQFIASDVYVRTNVNASNPGVNPIDNSGVDWQVTHGVMNGPGQCVLLGANSRWTDIHFVSNAVVANGTDALIKDDGNQFFTDCYFDGTPGTAFIDRSSATTRSIYTNSFFLQSVANITGIPIVKEAASAGATFLGATVGGALVNGSSFTNFINTPTASSIAHAVILGSGWLAGNFLGGAAPAGCSDHFHSNIVAGVLQSSGGLLAAVQYGTAGGNTYTITGVTVAAVDSTNLTISGIVPPTGRVLVKLRGFLTNSGTSPTAEFGVGAHGSTTPLGPGMSSVSNSTTVQRAGADFLITGLTPGAAFAYDWLWANNNAAGTSSLFQKASSGGLQSGPLTLEVWAA